VEAAGAVAGKVIKVIEEEGQEVVGRLL